MILLSLGTHEQPFDRAISTVVPLAGTDPVLVQHGYTAPRLTEPGFEWISFMDFEVMRSHVAEASVIIGHGGVGLIMMSLRSGKVPVVIPRLRGYGEHVDDHQLDITETFCRLGLVIPCHPGTDIRNAVARAKVATIADVSGGGPLARAVDEAARRDPGGRRGLRRLRERSR